MGKRIWYEVWGQGEYSELILLCKVRSQGLARLIAHMLREHYSNVTVR